MIKSLHFLLSLTLCAIFTACGPGERERPAEISAIPEPGENTSEQLCYLQVTTGNGLTDSLLIHLTLQGNTVTGILHWLPAEKDKMKGTLQGTLHESIVTATYTYNAEGITAKEEKIFKLEADTLRMKTGELVKREGLWVLKDKDQAPFAMAIPRTACP